MKANIRKLYAHQAEKLEAAIAVYGKIENELKLTNEQFVLCSVYGCRTRHYNKEYLKRVTFASKLLPEEVIYALCRDHFSEVNDLSERDMKQYCILQYIAYAKNPCLL